jgi:hypothetical protein
MMNQREAVARTISQADIMILHLIKLYDSINGFC